MNDVRALQALLAGGVTDPATLLAAMPEPARALQLVRAENERLRQALAEIDRNCSFGADQHGMTEWGVQDVRRVARNALRSDGAHTA